MAHAFYDLNVPDAEILQFDDDEGDDDDAVTSAESAADRQAEEKTTADDRRGRSLKRGRDTPATGMWQLDFILYPSLYNKIHLKLSFVFYFQKLSS
jgi:hypothetical protein